MHTFISLCITCTLAVQVGEVLAQFAVEKQRAIETENYEMAEECKKRADHLRVHMYRQLNVFGLVEDTSVLGKHAVSGEWEGIGLTTCEWRVFSSPPCGIFQSVLQPPPTTASCVSVQPPEEGGGMLPSPSPLNKEANAEPEVRQAPCAAVGPTVASIEDRPLPALVNK